MIDPSSRRRISSLCLLLVAVSLMGCGYQLRTRPQLPGGLQGLVVGPIHDLTTDGRLGVRAARIIESRLGRSGTGTFRLEGTVSALHASPLGFDHSVALSECGIRVRLLLKHRDGRLYWDSGSVTSRAQCIRSSNLSTDPRPRLRAARRRALASAIDQALDKLETAEHLR